MSLLFLVVKIRGKQKEKDDQVIAKRRDEPRLLKFDDS